MLHPLSFRLCCKRKRHSPWAMPYRLSYSISTVRYHDHLTHQTRNSTLAVSATRARSFNVTTRISCRSIASTPNRYRSIASSSVSETARSGSTIAVNSSRALSTRCTPSHQLRGRISQPLRRLHIPLQRHRLKHPNHPIRPIPTIDLHRIARPRIKRSRNPLPHQPPHPSPLKLRPHRPRNRRAPRPLPFRLHLQRLDIHPHQLFQLRRQALRQARLHLGHLHGIRQRILENLHHRLDPRRASIRSRAAISPSNASSSPISASASMHLTLLQSRVKRTTALSSPSRLPQQDPDIRKLALHHIRHIPDQEELALEPFSQPSVSISAMSFSFS